MKRSANHALIGAVVALAALGSGCAGSGQPGGDFYDVVRVIDGDTIQIEGGESVRYLGIDTPEVAHPTKGLECYGPEATEKNRELVEGEQVRLEKDVTDRDKYGRLLRYVYVDGLFVNGELVRLGYAYSSWYPPDIKYQMLLTDLERVAREDGRGLWAACQP